MDVHGAGSWLVNPDKHPLAVTRFITDEWSDSVKHSPQHLSSSVVFHIKTANYDDSFYQTSLKSWSVALQTDFILISDLIKDISVTDHYQSVCVCELRDSTHWLYTDAVQKERQKHKLIYFFIIVKYQDQNNLKLNHSSSSSVFSVFWRLLHRFILSFTDSLKLINVIESHTHVKYERRPHYFSSFLWMWDFRFIILFR